MRWWDGTAWGPLAPGAKPIDDVSQGRTLAILSHFGIFAAYFVLPLVIRLTEGKKNEYVKHHSAEALNFMLTVILFWIVIGIPAFIVTAVTMPTGRHVSPPIGFFVMMGVWFVVGVGVLVCCVLGAVRASQGVWWRYPVSIRFVPGARKTVPATDQA
jgi:uncharacterized protein